MIRIPCAYLEMIQSVIHTNFSKQQLKCIQLQNDETRLMRTIMEFENEMNSKLDLIVQKTMSRYLEQCAGEQRFLLACQAPEHKYLRRFHPKHPRTLDTDWRHTQTDQTHRPTYSAYNQVELTTLFLYKIKDLTQFTFEHRIHDDTMENFNNKKTITRKTKRSVHSARINYYSTLSYSRILWW